MEVHHAAGGEEYSQTRMSNNHSKIPMILPESREFAAWEECPASFFFSLIASSRPTCEKSIR